MKVDKNEKYENIRKLRKKKIKIKQNNKKIN